MYNGPIRGGNRGGRDQFNWESVKADKDRVFYLGHSVKATVGRWQKDRDILWYTRVKKKEGNELDDEREAVKKREEDLMLEALGLKKPAVAPVGERKLEGHEIQELLRRGGEEGEAQPGAEEPESDRVKGLGFKPGNVGGVAVKEVLEGVGLDGPGWPETPQAMIARDHRGGGGEVENAKKKKKDHKEKKHKKSERDRTKSKADKRKSKKSKGNDEHIKKKRRRDAVDDGNKSQIDFDRVGERSRHDNRREPAVNGWLKYEEPAVNGRLKYEEPAVNGRLKYEEEVGDRVQGSERKSLYVKEEWDNRNTSPGPDIRMGGRFYAEGVGHTRETDRPSDRRDRRDSRRATERDRDKGSSDDPWTKGRHSRRRRHR